MKANLARAPGTVIGGRYRLADMLGDGGMGCVYRAADLQLGREVAVKLLTPAANAEPDIAARFEREARVGAALDHPHVVQTLDFGTSDGTLYLVLQLVPGRDLRKFELAHDEVPVPAIVTIAGQIADALGAAHAHRIIHRDLKPENILLEEDPALWARVADFGLAYIISPPDPRQGRLTHDGMVSGTPAYMSPEQVSDQEVGPPADVYAFGCLLYELAVGTTPFVGTYGKVFADHLYAPPVPPRARRADLPAALDELILRMLAKRAADRPTATIVTDRLAALRGPQPATARGHQPGTRADRMITEPPPFAEAAPLGSGLRIVVLGTPPVDLRTALVVAGYELTTAFPCDACVVIGGTPSQLTDALGAGAPVFVDADPRDFGRIAELLRLGVAGVVTTPISPAAVIGKLQRLRKGSPS